eukprot:4122445-Lingulodinium_polyedra.AAC.1
MRAAHCTSRAVNSSRAEARCPRALLNVCCLLSGVHCALFNGRRSLRIVSDAFFVARSSL